MTVPRLADHSSDGARRALRILFISDFYPPVIGGLERYVQLLARQLARRGHQVAVATLVHRDSPAFEDDEGVRVYRLKAWSRVLAPFYESAERRFHPTVPDPGVVASMRGVLAREQPEIVHAQGWMLYSFLPLTSEDGPRLLVGLHDYGLVCVKKTYTHKGGFCDGPAYGKCLACASGQYGAVKALGLTSGLFLSGRMHRRVDRWIANSRTVAEVSSQRPLGATETIDVVPAVVPDGAAEAAACAGRPAFLPPTDSYLLFVGALGRHKGLDVLLEAWASLSSRPHLVLIGTTRGDTPGRFPPGVTVALDVPHRHVMAAWARCLVAVVPSVWPEPFGQVAAEAMACGRPVVASAVGGLRDIVVHGETGLLVPPGDSVALRSAVEELLADEARRARMGEAGRRRAQRFMVSVVADRLERIYEEDLGRKAERDRPRRNTYEAREP
jgi:glycosyltransferase involved in cell wall biosynthesis